MPSACWCWRRPSELKTRARTFPQIKKEQWQVRSFCSCLRTYLSVARATLTLNCMHSEWPCPAPMQRAGDPMLRAWEDIPTPWPSGCGPQGIHPAALSLLFSARGALTPPHLPAAPGASSGIAYSKSQSQFGHSTEAQRAAWIS